MRRRASIVATLALGLACDRGSASRPDQPQPLIRIAVPADVDYRALVEAGGGHARHLEELISEPVDDVLEVVEQRGSIVRLRLRDHDTEALKTVAARLRHPGLESARASGQEIIAELETADFNLAQASLEGGTHQLVEGALVLEPRSGQSAVALELVAAPLERHWRLLNGGHVDIAPTLQQHEATKLEQLSSIRVVELPPTQFIALVFGDDYRGSRASLAEKLDLDAIARVVCGANCRADYPIAPSPSPDLDAAPPKNVEILHLAGADAHAIGARAIAYQLLEHGIDVRVVPLALEALSQRGVNRDFELLLSPAPTSPEVYAWFLERMALPPDHIIPLWTSKLYAAYDTSICNVEPDSATSWRWLADARPCEVQP